MKKLTIVALAAVAGHLVACGGGGGGGQIGPTPVASVTVSPPAPQLTIGATLQMSATAQDAAGGNLPGRTFTWTSDDTSKATVSATGLVRGVAEGSARISAATGGRSGFSTLNVLAPVATPPVVGSVVIEPANAVVAEGGTQPFDATVRDTQGKILTGRGMHWSIPDSQIAVVDGAGRATALRVGLTSVSVRVDGQSATAGLRVEADYPFELVYDQSADDGTTAVYTLDISDSAAVASRLPHAANIVSGPAAAPDGSKIAVVVQTPSGAVIEVLNRDGSGRRQLTLPGGDADQPAWSPDGSTIAYRLRLPAAGTDIWVMDAADGSNALNLTASHGATNQSSPAWSARQPDGSYRIAYSHSENGLGQIWSMRADGSDKLPVTASTTAYDDFPSWSPDGARIAFVRSGAAIFGDLYVVDANGGSGGLLMQLAGPLAGPQRAPAWSPDGRLLAFASRHAGDKFQIYTVWADGTRLAQRTADAADNDQPNWLNKISVTRSVAM